MVPLYRRLEKYQNFSISIKLKFFFLFLSSFISGQIQVTSMTYSYKRFSHEKKYKCCLQSKKKHLLKPVYRCLWKYKKKNGKNLMVSLSKTQFRALSGYVNYQTRVVKLSAFSLQLFVVDWVLFYVIWPNKMLMTEVLISADKTRKVECIP